MNIKGKFSDYSVYATQSGWSYYTVSVYKDFRFLWFNFKKKVYESETGLNGRHVMRLWEVRKLHKDQFEKWFHLVVKEYESVLESFEQESTK